MRRIALVLGVVVGVLAIGASPAGAWGGGAKPAATGAWAKATPGTGLRDGDLVKVTGAGFDPRSPVVVLQCARWALGGDDCDQSTSTVRLTSALGGVMQSLHVLRELSTFNGPVECAPDQCMIVVASAAGPGPVAFANLAFDDTVAPPPPPTLSATVDAVSGVVAPAGRAVVSGTVTCNRPMWVQVFGDLRQFYGRILISSGFTAQVWCGGGTVSWTDTVRIQNGKFAPGAARVIGQAFAEVGDRPVWFAFDQKIKLVAMT